MGDILALLTFFGLIITKTVDTLRNSIDPTDKFPKVVWNGAAFALGIVVTFVWQLNALEQISGTPAQGVAGQIITGFGLGAAGSGFHELLDGLHGLGGLKAPTSRS